MGMDVSGKAPSCEKGKYFGANVWSWRPIHAIIGIVNEQHEGELVDDETLGFMGSNDGAGLDDQESCDKLADAIEEFINDEVGIKATGLECVEGEEFGDKLIRFPLKPGGMIVNAKGQFLKEGECINDDCRSPYGTYRSHIEEFITFLRHCGGFEVW